MNTARKLLVVEDIPKTLAGTLMELAACGYDIAKASNVEDAMHALADTGYDALILDWSIPVAPGTGPSAGAANKLLEFLQSDRVKKENRRLPFLIVTAHPNIVNEAVLSALPGFVGVIYKLFVDDIITHLGQLFTPKN